MKRIITFFLAVCMAVSCVWLPISAVENDDSSDMGLYRWSHIMMVDDTISFNGTKGTYYGTVEGGSEVDNITAKVTLYYKNIRGNWVDLHKDWEYSVDADSLDIVETFSAVVGREYKVVFDITVYAGSDEETVSRTSYATCEG